MPVFGTLVPLPATPLYQRLETAGRLTRPKHWLDFQAFQMAHKPLKMTISGFVREVEPRKIESPAPARAVTDLPD